MNEIQKIPGNKHAIKVLTDCVNNGEAIAFVGAGASAGLYPLWKELINQLAEEAVSRGLTNKADKDFWISNAELRPGQSVRGIKEALGPQVYASVVQAIFFPRLGSDMRRYTPTQGALLKIGFQGIVTTNYDPGLIEARHSKRPDVANTGYATWQDRDNIHKWLTGDIFKNQICPILFAHGYYQRPETIVLSVSEYRKVYRPGLFRRLFEKLWSQERLVIVGFSFSDPWLNFICDEVISQSTYKTASEPRHIAIIGLHEDQQYSPEIRRMFHNAYNAEVIFYPVIINQYGDENHDQILELLESLSNTTIRMKKDIPKDLPKPLLQRPELWMHETTNDDCYTGRHFPISRLDNWAKDPNAKVIVVTGMGGQGKTALIGHWVKIHGGSNNRPHFGLFYWSFYVKRDVEMFFDSFLKYSGWKNQHAGIRTKADDKIEKDQFLKNIPRVENAIKMLKSKPFIIILDGLEVIQERPGTAAYGKLLEDDLREFLDSLCRIDHSSLIVLTSRFPFSDLTPYLGAGLRSLDLTKLPPDEGAELLAHCDVGGTARDRANINDLLEGHPLALRIFAATLATQAHGDPTRLWNMIFKQDALREHHPLEGKLRRLLRFYDSQLPRTQRIILGILSLFRYPVDESVVIALARGMIRKTKPSLESYSNLLSALNGLRGGGLLLTERINGNTQYSCHPVLRDHFRSSIIKRGGAVTIKAARLLSDRPSSRSPKDLQEILPILDAIEILVEGGFLKAAHSLYQERLNDGEIFLTLPAVHEGRRCVLSFVAEDKRIEQTLNRLSRREASFYLNSVGLFSSHAGEPEEAAKFYKKSAQISKSARDRPNQSVALRSLAVMLTHLGKLDEAQQEANRALKLIKGAASHVLLSTCYADLGYIYGLKGHLIEAGSSFREAQEEKIINGGGELLYGIWEIEEADFLLRIGRINAAELLAQKTLRISQSRKWLIDVAECFWILSRCYMKTNNIKKAYDYLSRAELIVRRGHMLMRLPCILITKAELMLYQRSYSEALRYADEAFRIAAPRKLRLSHADSLLVRAAILLAQSDIKKDSKIYSVLDDADAALQIAKDCDYVWARKNAHALLSDAFHRIGDSTRSRSHKQEADAIKNELISKLARFSTKR